VNVSESEESGSSPEAFDTTVILNYSQGVHMTKRISRKALALAAIGVIAAPAFATVANAQIGTQAIATTLKAVGPVPSGVTGSNVSISCKNTTNNPGEVVAAFALTPGQTASIPSFQLNAGSSCKVTATNSGSANTSRGQITISAGGNTSGLAFATGNGPSVSTDFFPVTSATDVQITMSFAQITVKKVVVGDEATAGFAYPMSIACSNPISPIFVSPANGLEAGGAGSYVSIPVTNTVAAVGPQRAFVATASKAAVWSYGWTQTATTPAGGNAAPGGAGVVVQNFLSPIAPTSTVPLASTVFPLNVINPTAFILTPGVAASPDITAAGYSGFAYAVGDIVVPGANAQNYILIPVYTLVGTTVTLTAQYALFDAGTTGTLPTITPATGAPVITSILGNAAGIASINITGAIWNGPATTPATGVSLVPGTAYTSTKANYVTAVLINAANLTAGSAGSSTPGFVRVYDYRTDPATIPAGNLLGNWANLGTGSPVSIYTQTVNAINSLSTPQPTPNVAGGFNGTFALKGGESKSFSFNEFPNLTSASKCEVWETNGGGATATAFSSTNPADANGIAVAPSNGVTNSAGRWQSALTSMNQTVTVTNSFYGDMIISKVVTGDPKTNVATYEISVACDKGGPKDTFLIKDRQSKVYSNIASGTNCLITETKSDGAVASYKDNSGDNTTDGRVTIKRRPVGGCGDVLGVTGAPTAATPGGPAPTTTFNECWASIIITNDYNPVAAPETTKAAAAAPATAAPATAAPAVAPAPAVAVDATPTFAG
jgi:hypothetical protein